MHTFPMGVINALDNRDVFGGLGRRIYNIDGLINYADLAI